MNSIYDLLRRDKTFAPSSYFARMLKDGNISKTHYTEQGEPYEVQELSLLNLYYLEREILAPRLKKAIFGEKTALYAKAQIHKAFKQLIQELNEELVAAGLNPIQLTDWQMNVMCLRYLIEDLAGVDPKTFYNQYSTQTLNDLKARSLVLEVLDEAPDKLKQSYLFVNKDIIFAACWPTLAPTVIHNYSVEDIYNCSGELKNSLKRIARTNFKKLHQGEILDKTNPTSKTQRGTRETQNEGGYLDRILYQALNDILERSDKHSFKEKLEFMCTYPEFYASTKTRVPGIFDVIMNRQCYMCALDFFMFNSPASLQTKYLHEYLNLRDDYNYPKLKAIDVLSDKYMSIEFTEDFQEQFG